MRKERRKITKKERKEITRNKQKIILGVSTIILSGFFACYVTHFMATRLVKNIYWLPQTNKIQINFFSIFCGDKPVILDPTRVQKLERPRRFDKTVKYEITGKILKNQLISTSGIGSWSHQVLFDYITGNTGKIMRRK